MAKDVRKNVENILHEFPETRNCDKQLIVKYWQLVDMISMNDINEFLQGFIDRSTSTESIRRARQLIQEEGYYLPTDETVAKRRMRQKKMKYAIKEERNVV